MVSETSHGPEFRLSTSYTINAELSEAEVRNHYALVGAIATQWASLEYTIDVVLCRLAGLPGEVGFCLTYQIQSIRNKLLAIEALLHLRGAGPGTIKEVRQFMNGLEATTKARNRAMHDQLLSDPSGKSMQFSRRYVDKRLVFGYEPTDIKELKDTLHVIGSKIGEFNTMMNKTITLWPPLPETPLQPPFSTPPGLHPGEQKT